MKASIIAIGTELLIGQTIDTNSAYLGEQLTGIGIDVIERYTIKDQKEDILRTLTQATEKSDWVLITGGLGPTKDDITKETIGVFLGEKMIFNNDVKASLTAFYKSKGYSFLPIHEQQCYFPESTMILTNELGTAPGMLFNYKKTKIISMPGVPYEMKHIFKQSVYPLLVESSDEHIEQVTLRTSGMGESKIATLLEELNIAMENDIELAYLPEIGGVKLRLTAKHSNATIAKEQLNQTRAEIESILKPYIYGINTQSLSESLGNILDAKGLMMGTAESCTGGKVASLITEKAGASSFYSGSIIAYTNAMKVAHLGVQKETLDKFGAVSEQTVTEMLNGLLEKLPCDVGIAISGIAGPGGGTPEKPVGTVWIACGNEKETITKQLNLKKNRILNIQYTCFSALNLLRKFVLSH